MMPQSALKGNNLNLAMFLVRNTITKGTQKPNQDKLTQF